MLISVYLIWKWKLLGTASPDFRNYIRKYDKQLKKSESSHLFVDIFTSRKTWLEVPVRIFFA